MGQKERLKQMFVDRPGEWIPLPDILDLRMAQFGARLFSLRREGMNIQNKCEMVGEEKHSWYMYLPKGTQMELFNQTKEEKKCDVYC